MKKRDLLGQVFGQLTVIAEAPSRRQSGGTRAYWLCRCECGTELEVQAGSLVGRKTQSCGHRKNLVGEVFGRLTVIAEAPPRRMPSGQLASYWLCRCECGTEKEIGAHLVQGTTRSCGCLRRDNLLGQTFGRLTVIAAAPHRLRPAGAPACYWLCRCQCGTEKEIAAGHLVHGSIRSCGCLRDEIAAAARNNLAHGMTGTPTYTSWVSMRQRCRDPNTVGWRRYGGRGISVCERWEDFDTFLADMGERPDGTTLDRIDNDGNYEPGNVRWATPPEQSNNQSTTQRVTFNGRTQSMSQWAHEVGLPPSVVCNRIRRSGWSVDKALTTPVRSASDK